MPLTIDQVRTLVDANNKSSFSTEFIVCQCFKESSFVPDATNPGSSALGLMQITKAALDYVNANTPPGVHFIHDDLSDPTKNIQCGTYYLDALVRHLGSEAAALAQYGGDPHYGDSIYLCETCLKNPVPHTLQYCLDLTHP
jgi:membrane-bound lytic murein transglycosylase MltF